MSEKKIKKIAIIALILSFLAVGISESTITTVNNTVGLQIVVNNTNLAPTIEPNVTGTGERLSNTTYYNNNSDIEIFLYAHANSVSQTSDIELWINNTMVSSISSKPVGAAPEQNNKSIVAIIPRYSAYQARFANFHHYEWREYQILSGNFTSSIIVSNGTTNHANLTNLNWASANHTIDTDINMQNNSILQIDSIGKVAGGTTTQIQFVDSGDPVIVSATNLDANNYTQYYQRWDQFYWFVSVLGNFTSELTLDGGLDYTYNGTNKLLINNSTAIINTTLDLNGNDIINNGKSITTSQNTSWINVSINLQRTSIINYDHIFYIPYNSIGYDIVEQFVNGDINSSNYSYQSFSASSTTLTGTRDPANAYILAGFIYETSLASGTMSLGADGIFRGSHINSRRNAGNIEFENFAYVYKVPLISVNSLNYSVVFNRSFAFSNGFGNGTRMTFRRV